MPMNRKRKAGVTDMPDSKPTHERGEFDVVSQEEVDEIMKNYDPESNVRVWSGWQEYLVKGILAAFSVYTIYVTLFATLLDQVRLPSFVGMGILMGYLVYPAKKGKQKINHIPWYDWIIMILGTAAFFYFAFNAVAIIKQGIYFAWYEYVIGAIGILALAELCRRSVGIPILCVAGFFIAYALYFFSQKLGFVGAVKTMIYRLFYTTTGIFTTPIDVCSKYIAVFIIFGAFLERTGISDFFIQLANSLAGSASGGPAKVAVISSALCGMVSGSSVGNTVTTGSVTIPMMKRTGYPGEFAGAVEAASSTGGQIMPPIMGAAAFLMAEIVGVPYSNIIVRAILPAILYFTGIFLQVHLRAKKLGLKGIPRVNLPKWSNLWKKLYLLIPLVALVVMIMRGRTMSRSAIIATALCVVVSLINKDNRMTVDGFFTALENGGRNCLSIAIACGVAGIIAGVVTLTGLGQIFISAIVGLANGNLMIALFFTMITCIILGMGVPTTANYIIMATTCAPILTTGMGMHPIAANMFVFYFGIVADITPPVALAAYAGSAIAKSNPMKTAVQATRLAIAAFLIPYIFALNPAMLFIDTDPLHVILIIITSFLGMFGVATGIEGYFVRKLNAIERIIVIVGGLLMLYPGTVTDLIGIAIVAGIGALQYLQKGKANA